jgi:hypothetical protein
VTVRSTGNAFGVLNGTLPSPSKLQTLYLPNSGVTILGKNFLSKSTTLKMLHLSSNPLQGIETGACDAVSSTLTSVSIKNTPRLRTYPTGFFDTLTALSTVSIDERDISFCESYGYQYVQGTKDGNLVIGSHCESDDPLANVEITVAPVAAPHLTSIVLPYVYIGLSSVTFLSAVILIVGHQVSLYRGTGELPTKERASPPNPRFK